MLTGGNMGLDSSQHAQRQGARNLLLTSSSSSRLAFVGTEWKQLRASQVNVRVERFSVPKSLTLGALCRALSSRNKWPLSERFASEGLLLDQRALMLRTVFS